MFSLGLHCSSSLDSFSVRLVHSTTTISQYSSPLWSSSMLLRKLLSTLLFSTQHRILPFHGLSYSSCLFLKYTSNTYTQSSLRASKLLHPLPHPLLHPLPLPRPPRPRLLHLWLPLRHNRSPKRQWRRISSQQLSPRTQAEYR